MIFSLGVFDVTSGLEANGLLAQLLTATPTIEGGLKCEFDWYADKSCVPFVDQANPGSALKPDSDLKSGWMKAFRVQMDNYDFDDISQTDILFRTDVDSWLSVGRKACYDVNGETPYKFSLMENAICSDTKSSNFRTNVPLGTNSEGWGINALDDYDTVGNSSVAKDTVNSMSIQQMGGVASNVDTPTLKYQSAVVDLFTNETSIMHQLGIDVADLIEEKHREVMIASADLEGKEGSAQNQSCIPARLFDQLRTQKRGETGQEPRLNQLFAARGDNHDDAGKFVSMLVAGDKIKLTVRIQPTINGSSERKNGSITRAPRPALTPILYEVTITLKHAKTVKDETLYTQTIADGYRYTASFDDKIGIVSPATQEASNMITQVADGWKFTKNVDSTVSDAKIHAYMYFKSSEFFTGIGETHHSFRVKDIKDIKIGYRNTGPIASGQAWQSNIFVNLYTDLIGDGTDATSWYHKRYDMLEDMDEYNDEQVMTKTIDIVKFSSALPPSEQSESVLALALSTNSGATTVGLVLSHISFNLVSGKRCKIVFEPLAPLAPVPAAPVQA